MRSLDTDLFCQMCRWTQTSWSHRTNGNDTKLTFYYINVLWKRCGLKRLTMSYIIHETVMIQIYIRRYRLEKLLTEKWKKTVCYLSWDSASSGNVAFFVTKECSWTAVIRLLTVPISLARSCKISLQFLILLDNCWKFCNKINKNMLVTQINRICYTDWPYLDLSQAAVLFRCTLGSL
jgi:hypothetical protein